LFERFSESARLVIVRAQEEARRLNHPHIGTEDLLLGLLSDTGTATEVLIGAGIDPVAAREEIERRSGKGAGAPSAHIPFTPQAKKVLELSLREALQLGHDYIGTEHLLLGLIREGEGTAAVVLVDLGVDLNRIRAQIADLVGSREVAPRVSLEARLASIEERLSRIEARLPPEDA